MAFTVQLSQEYFWVYKHNASRIGVLRHPRPQMVATFYTQCFSIIEDLTNATVPPSAQQSLTRLQELLNLFQNTTQLGQQIVALGA